MSAIPIATSMSSPNLAIGLSQLTAVGADTVEDLIEVVRRIERRGR